MDTSGILLVTLTAEAHRNLSRQFQERETKKRYIALLDGILERDEDSGTIELPFRLDIDNRPHQIYDPEFGKMGISHWKKVGDENGQSRIEFVPVLAERINCDYTPRMKKASEFQLSVIHFTEMVPALRK